MIAEIAGKIALSIGQLVVVSLAVVAVIDDALSGDRSLYTTTLVVAFAVFVLAAVWYVIWTAPA